MPTSSTKRIDEAPTAERVFGNAAVVELLERWLKAARLGSINYVAIAAMVPPNRGITEYGGSIEMVDSMPGVLDELKGKIETSLTSRKPPPANPMLTADYVCYNVAGQALGFDFIPWLVCSEMTRIRLGAPAPLKVHFWAGTSGKLGLETEYRRTTFESIVRPALKLIGAVEDPRAIEGRCVTYRLSEIGAAVERGERVPRFKPSAAAIIEVDSWFRNKDRMVTITLREADHMPHRNSNIDAWLKFARWLEASGQGVVIVRDTAKADEPLFDFATCPEASLSLDLRMALYERAKCNLFVSNGPGSLAWFGTKPWLQFIKIDNGSLVFYEHARWWKEAANMEVGDQYPWSAPDQRIVWDADTYENICKAWGGLCLSPAM